MKHTIISLTFLLCSRLIPFSINALTLSIDIPFGDGSYKEHALLIEAGKMYRLYIDGTKEGFFN